MHLLVYAKDASRSRYKKQVALVPCKVTQSRGERETFQPFVPFEFCTILQVFILKIST